MTTINHDFMRLKGMKIREEFLCPITYEIFRDPVVASDGNTYERSAIEDWIIQKRQHVISPLTGENITSSVIPNTIMKKLIQDLVLEGGLGLYKIDSLLAHRVIDIVKRKTLILTCHGATESEWLGKSIVIQSNGCIGGRGQSMLTAQEKAMNRDVVIFSDLEVSRRHFEIALMNETQEMFGLRDVGSTGGCFIRLKFNETKELFPGMIFLLGTHQFTVSSIIEDDQHLGNRNSSNDHLDVSELVTETQELLSYLQISNDTTNQAQEQFQSHLRLVKLSERLNDHILTTRSSGRKKKTNNGDDDDTDASTAVNPQREEETSDIQVIESKKDINNKSEARKICVLTCFQPNGSAIMGKSYQVLSDEVCVIGKKSTNAIAVCSQTLDKDGNVKTSVIDNAISSEHACIKFNAKTGQFYISDGNSNKPSTNGTWMRLSGPQQESSFVELSPHVEILIGKSKFEVSESLTISERDVLNATLSPDQADSK